MKFGRIHKLLYVAILAALALATVVPAFAKTDARPNIVEIAASNPDFSTLVAAVQKAGLVDALDGPKRVTVFAPTNAAFDALAAQLGFANGMALVDALPAEDLTPILLYHVTNGNRSAKTLFPPQNVRMLSGDVAETSRMGGVSYIDGQPILATNIRASNGFIHVIGGVMLP
jgi:transforming growth factor-beta-induced protein